MPALPAAKAVMAAVAFAMSTPELVAHGGQYIGPTGPYTGPGDIVPPGPNRPRPRPGSGPYTGGPSGPSAPAPSGPVAPAPSGPSTGGPTPPSTGGPSGPSTGGPAAPSARGTTPAKTGGRRGVTIEDDRTAWHYWWEFNKGPYLNLRNSVHRGVQTGSDDFYLGATRAAPAANAMRPTARQTMHTVLPALKRALDTTEQRDITTASMIAMAKIGRDHQQFKLRDVFAKRLSVSNQEVRETAALALGIAGFDDGKSLDLLTSLVLDTADGRALSGGRVNARTRAFSAYAMGLTARDSKKIATKQRVFAALKPLVDSDRMRDRNIKVAAIHGIGLLGLTGSDYKTLKLREEAKHLLKDFFGRKLGRGGEWVQAHVPIALVRLAGVDRKWCIRLLTTELDKNGSRRRSNEVVQSCVQALGWLAAPYEDDASDDAAISQRLLKVSRTHKNAMVRRYALMALARIGGASNRTALLRQFDRASKTQRRPWCALALGLLAYNERQQPGASTHIDDMIVDTLRRELRAAKNPGLVGSLAIGLGLAGATDASELLVTRLRGQTAKEQMAGYLCIGLALMGDKAAAEDIRTVLEESRFRPQLLVQAAMALGKLGDKQAEGALLKRMDGGANLVTLASCASALGLIGDRRSVVPLTEMLLDSKLSALPRAFSAAALGGICDRKDLPWNTPISAGINYNANVETLTDQAAGVLDIL